jgi:hypothetical protein
MNSRLIRIATSLALALLVNGCDPARSVNPFYRPQDVSFDPSLLGNWRGVDSLENGSLIVKVRTAGSYDVELTQTDKDKKNETSWTFEAHLFKHEGKTYLDLLPTSFRVSGKKERFHIGANELEFLVPVHTAMQLDQEGDKLSLSWTGGGNTSSLFKKEDEASKEERLAREQRQRDTLTMSTEQLQREVLGAAPEGDMVVELGMHFIRKN